MQGISIRCPIVDPMKLSFHRSTSLSTQTLRELWRLRLSLVHLKSTVSHDDDFEAFVGDFRWTGYVWILRDGGEAVGFFLQRGMPMDFEGKKLLCFLPEYGFAAPRVHGHPILPLASLAITLPSYLRHPLRDKYVAASA